MIPLFNGLVILLYDSVRWSIMKKITCFWVLVVCFVVNNLSANEQHHQINPAGLTLKDELIQGAMVRGRAIEAEQVSVLGRTLRLTEDGRFVFGLGRDAEPELVITVVPKNGFEYELRYNVQQREYDIQYVEGVAKKYVSPPPEVSERISSDVTRVKAARANTRPVNDYFNGFDWPVLGRISGVYGSQRVFNGVPKRPHYGLDIARPVGTPIVAPANGVITLADADLYYSGGTIIMDHGDGISSTFIHLSKIDVTEGQAVKAGEKLGEIGATGRVTGPHLDWRINWFDQRLDPALLLPPQPAQAD